MKPSRCSTCREDPITPLVYQTGYSTKTDHLCEAGGIYISNKEFPPFNESSKNKKGYPYGFVAAIEPVGEVFVSFGEMKSKGILVRGIEAFCMGRECAEDLETIREGVLVPDRFVFGDEIVTRGAPFLRPICSLEKHPEFVSDMRCREATYNFQVIETGEVLLSMKGGE